MRVDETPALLSVRSFIKPSFAGAPLARPTVSIENLIKTTCPVFVQANFENCLQIIVLQAIDL